MKAGIILAKRTQELETPVKTNKDTWRARITNDWLPLPAEAITTLGWKDGDEIEMFTTHGQVILRKKGALSDIE